MARLPAAVVLTYRHSRRVVALDMGGCPAVVMRDGRRRYLLGTAERVIFAAYDKAAGTRT